MRRWLLTKIYEAAGNPRLRLALPGGTEVGPPPGSRVGSILIRDWPTLLSLAGNAEIAFGDAYTDGRIEVEGDLVEVLSEVYRCSVLRGPTRSFASPRALWLALSQRNTRHGSRHNIHHHYDLGNDFYKLWLDRQLVYTCAYFPDPSVALEDAQVAKMDHVCRKLRLQPGERVAEAGCGWGALAIHMAKYYGVKVRAFNISREQIAYARWRAHAEGLDDRVEFIQDDYRNIYGGFDAFVSVGMLEHVGKSHLADFSRVVGRSLGMAGRGLLHFIGRNYSAPLNAWIRKRIFPGGYPPALREVMGIFEPRNLAVLDVENLRAHYALTLEHWLDRFEGAAPQIVANFDRRFERMWRLYLAGSIAAFRAGSLQLFQVVFAAPACQAIPWTRAYLYEDMSQETRWTRVMS
jgi:cyclopropane-fatty-acyl-phospholipid synthase